MNYIIVLGLAELGHSSTTLGLSDLRESMHEPYLGLPEFGIMPPYCLFTYSLFSSARQGKVDDFSFFY